MALPGSKQAKLINSLYVNASNSALLLEFEMQQPTMLEFKSGQFVSVQVAENTFRAYSICSGPNDTNKFLLVITVDKPGVGANYFKNLKVGMDITFVGPSGRFFLKKPISDSLHFIATGTGIAPFISMLHSLKTEQALTNISLLVGFRYLEDVFFTSELENFKTFLPNFKYTVCLSQENTTLYNYGRVTDFIDPSKLVTSQNYLCGNPDMVEDVKNLLATALVPAENVFYEKFTIKTQAQKQ